ncbi:Hypp2399 [Branchiostoma lanceolatum]|uniref:Hypp2399 protein n=1 Tax=Branchiostoma lanceolatum TaxID=7740 RepID=A0A8K0EPS1_BRALA|nr:Hypp2399 [Branchiostoma lanceolatum]
MSAGGAGVGHGAGRERSSDGRRLHTFQNIDPQSGARASRLPQPMDRKGQSGAAERGRPRAAGGGGTGAGICCEKCNARLVELKRQALRLYVTSRGLLAHNVTVAKNNAGMFGQACEDMALLISTSDPLFLITDLKKQSRDGEGFKKQRRKLKTALFGLYIACSS